jgi:hypothetical protein
MAASSFGFEGHNANVALLGNPAGLKFRFVFDVCCKTKPNGAGKCWKVQVDLRKRGWE